MAASDDIQKFIRERESLRLQPYDDAKGRQAVGYGHLINPETIQILGHDPRITGAITEDEAKLLFQEDLKKFNSAVVGSVKVPLTQQQEDALTSFAYNVGDTAFKNSTLLKKLNEGKLDEAAGELGNWVYKDGAVNKGLQKRRQKEYNIFTGLDTEIPLPQQQQQQVVQDTLTPTQRYFPGIPTETPRQGIAVSEETPHLYTRQDPFDFPSVLNKPNLIEEPQEASFWEKVWAGSRESPVFNSLTKYLATSDVDTTPEPNYNPYKTGELKGFEDFAELFVESPNPAYTEKLKEWVTEQKNKLKIQQEGGITNFVSSLGFGLISPTTLIPIGGFSSKVIQNLSLPARIGVGVGLGGGAGALNETLLQASDPTRTMSESIPNVLLSAGLGGLFFSLPLRTQKTLKPKEYSESVNREKILLQATDDTTGSVGAMESTGSLSREDWVPVKPNLVHRGLSYLLSPLTPVRRIQARETSVEAPKMAALLVDQPERLGMNEKGFATPISVEGKVNVSRFEVMQPILELEQNFNDFKASGGNLSKADFLSETLTAYSRGEKYISTPGGKQFEVSKSTEALSKYFDKMGDRAVKAGVLDEATRVRLANQRYLHFMYDPAKIAADPKGFKDLIRRSLEKNIYKPELEAKLRELQAKATKWEINPKTGLFEEIKKQEPISFSAEEIESLTKYQNEKIALGEEVDKIFSDITREGYTGFRTNLFRASASKERTLNLSFEEAKNFLITDPTRILDSYSLSMNREISLKETFGTTDKDLALSRLDSEYQTNLEKAASESERSKLRKEYSSNRKDLSALWDKVAGRYALPEDPLSFWSRSANALKNLVYASRGGSIAISQIADLGYLTFTKGIEKTVGKEIVQNAQTLLGAKLSKQELQELGIGIQNYLNTRQLMHGISDFENRGYSIIEDWGARLTGLVSKITGTDFMNDFNQRIIASKTANQALIDFQKWKAGNLADNEIKHYLKFGIGIKERDAALREFNKHGFNEGGVNWANLGEWGEEGLAFKNYVRRITDKTIVMPAIGDKPNWMSTPFGSVVGQFKGFGFSSLNKVLLPGLQDLDRQFFTRVVASTMLGSVVYLTQMLLLGKKPSEIDMSPEKLVLEGVDRSGITGALFDFANTFERLSGFGINTLLTNDYSSRKKFATGISSLLGPGTGMIEEVARGIGGFATGKFNETNWNLLLRQLPLYNLWYWKWLTGKIGGELEEVF